jgi:hypothetical protein
MSFGVEKDEKEKDAGNLDVQEISLEDIDGLITFLTRKKMHLDACEER